MPVREKYALARARPLGKNNHTILNTGALALGAFLLLTVGVWAQEQGDWEPVQFAVEDITTTDPTGLHSAEEVEQAVIGSGQARLYSAEVPVPDGDLTLTILGGNACGMQDCYIKFALETGDGERVETPFGEAICQDFGRVEIDRSAMLLRACDVEINIAAALSSAQ